MPSDELKATWPAVHEHLEPKWCPVFTYCWKTNPATDVRILCRNIIYVYSYMCRNVTSLLKWIFFLCYFFLFLNRNKKVVSVYKAFLLLFFEVCYCYKYMWQHWIHNSISMWTHYNIKVHIMQQKLVIMLYNTVKGCLHWPNTAQASLFMQLFTQNWFCSSCWGVDWKDNDDLHQNRLGLVFWFLCCTSICFFQASLIWSQFGA